jgi:tetratricopeptide (TPR) repeat protein
VLLSSTPAKADDKHESKKHFKAGLALLEAEDYTAASAEFEISSKLYATKSSLFNLANCYKAMHQYGKALNTIDSLEAQFGNDLSSQWRGEIETFKKQLDAMTGKLVIVVNVDGAKLRVDGVDVATSPLSDALVLAPGSHKIDVEKDGYEPVSRTASLVSQEKNTIQIELTIIDTSDPDKTDPVPIENGESIDTQTEGKTKISGLFWVGLTGTILTGAASGVFLGLANAKANDYTAGGEVDEDLYNKSKVFGWTGVGLGIGAGIFAVGTIIVFIVDRKKSKDRNAVETVALPGSIAVRF